MRAKRQHELHPHPVRKPGRLLRRSSLPHSVPVTLSIPQYKKTGQTYRLPREMLLRPQLKYENLPALRETIPSLA